MLFQFARNHPLLGVNTQQMTHDQVENVMNRSRTFLVLMQTVDPFDYPSSRYCLCFAVGILDNREEVVSVYTVASVFCARFGKIVVFISA